MQRTIRAEVNVEFFRVSQIIWVIDASVNHNVETSMQGMIVERGVEATVSSLWLGRFRSEHRSGESVHRACD